MIGRLVASLCLVASAGASCADDSPPPVPTSTASAEPLVWRGIERSTSPMAAGDAAAVDATFGELIETSGDAIPGLWVGIWSADRGAHVGVYGEAVLGGAEATVDDHGRIGSITKTFTATAVLQRVQAGDIELDDTIDERLPELAAAHPEVGAITVQQLLGMTSGIPDYANTGLIMDQVVADPSRQWTADEIIEQVLDNLVVTAPGTPGYSTTNFLILGEMLEQLVGRPVHEILDDVAAELDLTGTALDPPGDDTMPDPSSHGYLGEPGVALLERLGTSGVKPGDVTAWSPSWGGAGSGMYSTIGDLGAWAASGSGTSLLDDETAGQRLQTTFLPDQRMDYGLGITDFGDGWIGHTGQILGWEALVLYNTDTGDTAAVMVNATGVLGDVAAALSTVFPELEVRIG